MTLTDTHLVLLSAAAQHPEHLLLKPDRIHGKAAGALAAKLMRAGFVEEVPIRTDQPHWRVQDDAPVGLRITREGLLALGLDEDAQTSTPAPDQPTVHKPAGTPRAGSKQAAVLALLGREQGATLADLIEVTGWLAHTTRAALTGLRQRGYGLDRSRGEDGRAVYRLQPEADAPVLGGGEG
jgi:hypothetical protein